MRRKAVWGWRVAMLALAALAVSCGDQVTQGKSSSYLIVASLQGARGAEPDKMGGTLDSDVVTTTKECSGCVWDDVGEVSLSLGLKDAGSGTDLNAPTSNNLVTVTQYRVEFKRADGRNTPGVDVPYPFDGAVTVTVGDGVSKAGFTIVRAQGKLEAPLMALRNGGFIATIAEVTFYGHDQTGREVSVTGKMGVTFADWADPKSS